MCTPDRGPCGAICIQLIELFPGYQQNLASDPAVKISQSELH